MTKTKTKTKQINAAQNQLRRFLERKTSLEDIYFPFR
jgi:hypothetical protein